MNPLVLKEERARINQRLALELLERLAAEEETETPANDETDVLVTLAVLA